MSNLYKTVVQVTVLSEGPLEEMDLEGLHYAITQGDCSGQVQYLSSEQVTSEQMRELLKSQGSDPEFFDPLE